MQISLYISKKLCLWTQLLNTSSAPSSVSGILCLYCTKAEELGLSDLPCNRDDAFTTRVFSNWQKALQRFQEHSSSHRRVSHHYATQPVDAQLSSQRAMQQSEARDCPKIIFTSIQYLAWASESRGKRRERRKGGREGSFLSPPAPHFHPNLRPWELLVSVLHYSKKIT